MDNNLMEPFDGSAILMFSGPPSISSRSKRGSSSNHQLPQFNDVPQSETGP